MKEFLSSITLSNGLVQGGVFSAIASDDLPAGTGTVTSVGLSLPAEFTVSGSPVTTTGTLAAAWANEAANLVFAGPPSGPAATPSFRMLVAADVQIAGLFFTGNGVPDPSLAYVGDYYLDLNTGVLYQKV